VPVAVGVRLCEPLVSLAPVQAPVAEQLSALVAFQVSVELAPSVIVVGATLIDTTGCGGAFAVTETLLVMVPPPPVQASVYVVEPVVVGVTGCEPLTDLEPVHPPLAEQEVLLVADQESVEDAPSVSVVGLAENVRSGGGSFTVTATESEPVPPVPVHEST